LTGPPGRRPARGRRAAARSALAALLALLALAFALVGRLILAHLIDHPDSPAVNVVLAALPPLAVASLLLYVALAELGLCGTATRSIIALLVLATVMPYGWLVGGSGVLLNLAVGVVTAGVLLHAWWGCHATRDGRRTR
jgi:hypothetical protein